MTHKPGKDNPADYMSRHPDHTTPAVTGRQSKVAVANVNFLSDHATPKAITLDEIKSATTADPVLQLAMSVIQTGQWKAAVHRAKTANRKNLESLKHVSTELCVNSDRNLILQGTKLVIPSALQDWGLAIAHEGHQGVVRRKQLLREKVWLQG